MPKQHASITQVRIADLIDRAETKLDSSGLRIVCRAVANDVEPDAAETICDSCGKPTAYGVATTETIAI